MLVVYTDDKGIGKAKHLVPIARNDTHFVFINPKNSKMELVLRTNVVRMEEIQKFRKELAESKKKIREVSLQRRQDIEALGTRVKMINIAVMPVLVIIASFLPLIWRSRAAKGG